ncbi:MAG: methylated-DNA--[protein]-cysteine S-methyltransferase [Treponema sp.]|nr:methylated-DNA--[protein]-cysteine S-methyltransferase [Treponema sp.]
MKVMYYDFPFCRLGIAEENNAICKIVFNEEKTSKVFECKETPLLKEAVKQLNDYFSYKRKTFDLPLSLHGTDFQIKVWKALQNIPYGETTSYGKLAAMTGNPKASRAVGLANNRNPIPIIVPCHRVIGSDGSLTGYAGGLELKQKLLDLEKGKNVSMCAAPPVLSKK